MIDRRRYARVNQRLSLLFYLADCGTEIHSILCRNISEGGLLLVAEEPVAVGTPIHVEIDFNDDTPAELVDGTVVRCEQLKEGIYGWGVEFGRVSPDLHRHIKAIVAECAGRGERPFEDYLLDHYIEECRKRAAEAVGTEPGIPVD